MGVSRPWAQVWTVASFATGLWLPIVLRVRLGARGSTSIDQAAPAPVALVLGAPVRRGLSAILDDRLRTGEALWRSGKAQRLVLTGTAEEVEVMDARLAERGVPGEARLRDPGARFTVESLRHARALGFSRVLLVTQAFHLPRALYLARRLGLEPQGVAADRGSYAHRRAYRLRELASQVLAFWMMRG